MRTARLAEEHDLVLKHTLFPLHPHTPEDGLTLEELFGNRERVEAATQRMSILMEAEGLEFGQRSHTFNSRRAQELAKWAEDQGSLDIHGALYAAYFIDGLNLSRLDVLEGVADAVGLNGSEAILALERGDHTRAVDLDWARSRTLGVTGVPTFVMGRYGVVGAQPYEALEQLLHSYDNDPEEAP